VAKRSFALQIIRSSWDEGIVFGVARLEPRSNSTSAGAKPGGIEAPVTIPSSPEVRRGGIVFGVARLEPRSNSTSAGAKPGGIEAPLTIPLSLRMLIKGLILPTC